MTTLRAITMLKPLAEGAVKRMEVREDTYLILHSLSQFGVARIDRRENVQFIEMLLGDAVDIPKPFEEDWPSMRHIWIIRAKKRIMMSEAKIRSASALNFRYQCSISIGET